MIQAKQLSFTESKTYLLALLFVTGNIIFPQLCHLIPKGGLIFLPIYFFTLIGSYLYGWRVGVLTAIASPLINCLFFGMPPVASLPAILLKSVTLALAAGYFANRYKKVSIPVLALIVLTYQFIGMSAEFLRDFDLMHALQDVRLGYPGILIQIFGAYFLLKFLDKNMD